MFSFEEVIKEQEQIKETPIVPKMNLSPDALLGGFMKDFGVIGAKSSRRESWLSEP